MKVKIFEKKSDDKIERVSSVEKLIYNDLSLFDKMLNLCNSIEDVKLSPNGENELIEILLSKFAKNIYFPRKGDNSERFDITFELADYKVVAEIEIPSSAILDAPRNLLDDYAVLKSRKGDELNSVVPLVICWDLPNKRTDYWNVITDVKNVLGLEIKTISILALAVHFWTNTPIDLLSSDYYLDYDNLSMKTIHDMLKEKGIVSDEFPGYFTPFK